MYPTISEYKEAILFAEDNFEQLKNLRPVLENDGSPVMTSGNFAVVFKMKDEQTGKLHAVKCFLREQEGRAEAYRMISEELEYVSSTFLTPIKYLDKELFVDTNAGDEKEFPVLLMDWVEGETLDKYIRKHLDDQYELSLLAYQFSRLTMWLMPQPFAHGDLKPDNILVKSDGTLVLVDYDGMYVPAMKGQSARELGSPDFRHPSRTEADFDEHIDDFSLTSILLSLKTISLQPSLLEEYGASDRLLFSQKDYRTLSESEALNALRPLMQDAELASLYSLFILALSQNNLSQISFRLFNLSRPERPQYEEENFSTKVTEEDLANAWTDEYGVEYSADRKRLLKASVSLKQMDYFIKDGVLVVCDGALQRSGIHSVTLPNSVVSIGNCAFADNVNMEYCNIPSSVKYISDINPWRSCFKIKNLDCLSSLYIIEKGILYSSDYRIAYGLIYWRPAFSNICIDNRTKKIAAYAFWTNDECNSLITSITFTCVELIGISAFQGCKGITSIHIPDSVTTIGDSAFSCCSGLTSIRIPDSVATIGYCAFSYCRGLTNIHLPDSVTTIGESAFEDCSGLTSIHIPDSVTVIGDSAFSCCSGLTNITVDKNNNRYYSDGSNAIIEKPSNILLRGCKNTIIPDGVVCIGDDAFSGCIGLTNIHIPNSVKTIGESAFIGCSGLTSIHIPDSVTTIKLFAFTYCSALTSIHIPDSVTTIDEGIFWDCNGLTCIYIPDSVTTIIKSAFHQCSALTRIIIPIGTIDKFEKLLPEHKDKLVEQDDENLSTVVTQEDLANAWIDEYGVKYSKDRKKLLKAPKGLREYDIMTGTKAICDMAFCEFVGGGKKKDFDGIVSITIPDSVEQVGEHALLCCDDLSYIYIPVLTKQKFEKLIPGYKYKLVELLDINDKKGWRIKERRPFSSAETQSIKKAEVVDSQFGNSAGFYMNSGGFTTIPLVSYSSLAIGDIIDLSKANIVTLSKDDDCDLMRVEI